MISEQRVIAFIGSYADSSSPGIYICAYDVNSGALALQDSISGLKNPTFLDVDERNQRLYAISQDIDNAGQSYGEVAAYSIEPETFNL